MDAEMKVVADVICSIILMAMTFIPVRGGNTRTDAGCLVWEDEEEIAVLIPRVKVLGTSSLRIKP